MPTSGYSKHDRETEGIIVYIGIGTIIAIIIIVLILRMIF